MAGRKTHEQQLRTFERKPDVPDARRTDDELQHINDVATGGHEPDRSARQSEFAVSRGGMNQESTHNKHNHPGQQGHEPQKHRPAEEGH
jgi:hypothetical protein